MQSCAFFIVLCVSYLFCSSFFCNILLLHSKYAFHFFFMAALWFHKIVSDTLMTYDNSLWVVEKDKKEDWRMTAKKCLFSKWQIALFIVCQNYLLSNLLKYWSDVRIMKKQIPSLQNELKVKFCYQYKKEKGRFYNTR